MTIAACYVSAEGVVFGADSTSTMYVPRPGLKSDGIEHHYNYAQKIFEIGHDSTLAITMWGLGNLCQTSAASGLRNGVANFAKLRNFQGVATVPTPKSKRDGALGNCVKING